MQVSQVQPPRVLLCFDFDGTFLDSEAPQPFDPEILDRLLELKRWGALWCINTGRSLPHTVEAITRFRIIPTPDFIIARESEIYTSNEFNRWIDWGDWNKQCAKDHKRLYRTAKKFFKNFRVYLESETRAEWISHPLEPAGIHASSLEEMNSICQMIDSMSPPSDLSYHRNSVYLRFNHIGYSKGTAMDHLGRSLGIGPEFRLAMGDNHNDLSMLQPSVAHGIACPSNAIPEIKAHVARVGGFVAKRPITEGVIDALEHFLYTEEVR
ncbi:MAG: HAD family hydrolase [Verrucomicrobiales bacterium]